MITDTFTTLLTKELSRIDNAKITKRDERLVERYTAASGGSPRAVIRGKEHLVFNSNDYLGLRHHPAVKKAEHEASSTYGAGPGAVRFISGSMALHRDLEKALARFHGHEDCIIFSSCFAANLGALHALINGQSRDSAVHGDTLVVSDALNHRSIIDGIRVAGLPKEQRVIFTHLDMEDLDRVLTEHEGSYKRVLVMSDGIFSMLGEAQDLRRLQKLCDMHSAAYEEGVISIIDDSHGVFAYGTKGRGVEGHFGTRSDVLIGTMGKGLGVDGGYVCSSKVVVDYLRESAATYIYSNPISPGTAGAALKAVSIVDSSEGAHLLKRYCENIFAFKDLLKDAGFRFAADSSHGVQPILIGDAAKTRALVDALYEAGILVTGISYPIVPKGQDEIRAQISAAHSEEDLENCVKAFATAGKKIGLI